MKSWIDAVGAATIALSATALALSACVPVLTSTTPVVVVGPGDENDRFIGTATSTNVGNSRFEIQNIDGVICTGSYIAIVVPTVTTGYSTRGTLTCSNGEDGTWLTTGTAYGGQGVAKINGRNYQVFFGHLATVQQLNNTN